MQHKPKKNAAKHNPTKRIKEDELRLRNLERSLGKTPGPQQYSPHHPREESDKAKLGGSAAFRSKSAPKQRQKDIFATEAGDPGSYEPQKGMADALIHRRNSKGGSSQRKGKDAFGTSAERTNYLQAYIRSHNGPSPGAYHPDESVKMIARRGQHPHGSAFMSKTKRSTLGRGNEEKDGPSPQAYTLAQPAPPPRMNLGSSGMQIKEKRFMPVYGVGEAVAASEPHVGPGAYDQKQRTIESDVERVCQELESSSFMSRTLRTNLRRSM